MSTVAIIAILDVLFVVILVVGFLQGFFRGVKRSALEFGITIAGVIIAGLITPVVTNALLGITVNVDGQAQSLNTFFVNMISQDESIAAVIESSPSLEAFLTSLPQVLLCAVVYLVLNLVMRLVCYIIYKIIAVISFKSKKKEKALGLKRNKWVGGAIGTLKAFVLALVICMPLTSLVKLVDNNIGILTASAATIEEGDQPAQSSEPVVPEMVTNLISGVNSSFFGVLNGAVGLDDFIFDNISKFDMNDETVYVRRDVSNYLEIYKTVSNIVGSDLESISSIDWDEMDEIYKQATEGTLYNAVVLNVVSELVENYNVLINAFPQLEDFSEIFRYVSVGINNLENPADYFKNDIDKVYSMVSTLARDGYIDEVRSGNLNAEDAVATLANNYSSQLLQVLEDLTSINLLHDAFSPTLDYALSLLDESEITNILKSMNTSISDWPELKNELYSMFTNFGQLSNMFKAQNLSITGVLENFTDVLSLSESSIDGIFNKLGQMLDLVDNMEIAKDNTGAKLLPKVLESLGLGDGNLLNVQPVEGEDGEITNYEDFFGFLSTPVKEIIGLDLQDALQNGNVDMNVVLKKIAGNITVTISASGERTYSETIGNIVLPIYRITALHDMLFGPVFDASASTGIVDLSLLEEPGYDTDFASCYANWQHDLPLISQVLYELEAHFYDREAQITMLDYMLSADGDINEVIKMLDDETVDLIVPPIMQAISLKPLRDQLSTAVVENINDMLSEGNAATLDLNAATYDPASNEDQTGEIVSIVKSLVEILKSSDALTSLDSLDKTLLGQLLENLKDNAYRVELSASTDAPKTEVGVFRSIFDAMIAQAEYELEVTFTDVIDVQGIYEVDFTQIFNLIELASDAENAFSQAFKDIVLNGNNTTEAVDSLIEAIKVPENQEMAKDILDTVNAITENHEFKFNFTEEQTAGIETAISSLEEEGQVSSDLIDGLRNLFGLSGGENA